MFAYYKILSLLIISAPALAEAPTNDAAKLTEDIRQMKAQQDLSEAQYVKALKQYDDTKALYDKANQNNAELDKAINSLLESIDKDPNLSDDQKTAKKKPIEDKRAVTQGKIKMIESILGDAKKDLDNSQAANDRIKQGLQVMEEHLRSLEGSAATKPATTEPTTESTSKPPTTQPATKLR